MKKKKKIDREKYRQVLAVADGSTSTAAVAAATTTTTETTEEPAISKSKIGLVPIANFWSYVDSFFKPLTSEDYDLLKAEAADKVLLSTL
jgi:hypothetical protein